MWLAASAAWALGPHEVLVLANSNSAASVRIAQTYVRLRQIPQVNLVYLNVTNRGAPGCIAIPPEQFTKEIWDPATKAVADRGLEDHILAWVYSVDFPIRITTDPPLSLMGLTFLRNNLPLKREIDRGTYGSPLFAGPDGPGGSGFAAQSFDVQQDWLSVDMPLPSMMLGFTGQRGNTEAEVLACLERGAKADGTSPTAGVYFVTSDDIRSKCRQWQFGPAAVELAAAGFPVAITNAFPRQGPPALGIMLGAATVDPSRPNGYVPGAIGEHLTSLAGYFDVDGQTKLTAWLKAGATASAGTVTEPMSIWSKFPSARVYVHVVAGCTLLESLYQSIRCPLQILLVGEPLAAPFSHAGAVVLDGLPAEPLREPVVIRVKPATAPGLYYGRYQYLVDGQTVLGVGRGSEITLDPARYEGGVHRLRAVAYTAGSVRQQTFVEATFTVGRGQPPKPGAP